MELIYKLDLPPLVDILTEFAQRRLFIGRNMSIYRRYHPRDLLRPEWITYRGIPWDFVSFFYKHNYRGIIHSDHGDNVWGINWIYQGRAVIEYWEENDIIRSPTEPDVIGSPVIMCSAMAPPSRVYTLEPGAYLFNAQRPHRPSGFDHRYALSLRCTAMNTTWVEAQSLFSDLIINSSL